MAHLRDVRRHHAQAGAAHREAHEEALREAAVARAQADAQRASQAEIDASQEEPDGG